VRFVKIRQMWAWGCTPWHLREVPERGYDGYDSLGEYLEARCGNDNESDKYRGVQWKPIVPGHNAEMGINPNCLMYSM